MIAGFEELVIRCRDETSRNHIVEAIRCYESSAYRAAIVTTYMAVCFDLIAKLKALAASGDSKASELLKDLSQLQDRLDAGNSQAISGLLAFERNLLEKFRDEFEFFGVHEFDDLSRLRDDRNRCAHPTFLKTDLPYEPAAELARLHIRNALSLVLTQEPRQGKAALAEIRSIITSKYFPDNAKEAKTRLDAAGISNARDALIRAIIDDIVFGLATKDHPFYKKISPLKAFDAVIELRRPTALPRAVANINKILRSTEDEAIEIGAVITIRNTDISSAIDKTSQSSICQWISKAKYAFIPNAVNRELSVDWLRSSSISRLKSLTAEEIKIVSAPVHDDVLQRAADIYVGARSWSSANELSPKCAIPFADKFKESHIRFIFNEATNGSADLRGSSGFSQFIDALYSESPLGKDKLNELTQEFSLELYRPE